MRRLIMFIPFNTIIIFLCFKISAQIIETKPEIIWERNFGGTENEQLTVLMPTSEGGYIAAGYAESDDELIDDHNGSTSYSDAWVVKITSSNGVITWANSYGGNEKDQVTDLVEVSNGYVLAGVTASNDPNDDIQNSFGLEDAWVFRLNDVGQIIWSYGYGTSQYDRANTIAKTNDGGFLVGGFKVSSKDTAWLFKVNENGIQTYDKYSDTGPWGRNITEIINTSDGGYLFIGDIIRDGVPCSGCFEAEDFNDDIWIVKLDKDLAIEWNKQYGGGGCDDVDNVLEVDDGYILSGFFDTCSVVNPPQNFTGNFLMHLDLNGNIDWIKPSKIVVNNTEVLDYKINRGAFDKTVDGGLISGGQRVYPLSYYYCIPVIHGTDYLIVKYDIEGNPLWMENYGGSYTDQFYSIHEIYGGGYIIGGNSQSSDIDVGEHYGDNSTYDWWIAELSPEDEYCHLDMDASQAYANITGVTVNNMASSYVVDADQFVAFSLSARMNVADTHTWYIMIDFNRDFDFDDNNELLSFDVSAPPDINNDIVTNIFIPIPSHALNGITRMRIVLQAYGNITDFCLPCIPSREGDVHDYDIQINSSNLCHDELTVSINPIPSGTYTAISKISSASVIAWGADVTFMTLGEVDLNPTFEVQEGSTFKVLSADCSIR